MRPTFLHINSTLYWTIYIYDPDTGLLKDADYTPSVTVRKNGVSTIDVVTITKRSASVGIYDCSYNPASEAEGDKFIFEESAAVTGTATSQATYNNVWAASVIAIENNLNASGVRSAIGLNSANIDIQFANIPSGVLSYSMPESYAASGSNMTMTEAMYMIHQSINHFSISGAIVSVKRLDGTEAATFTLNSPTRPTARSRS